MNIYALSNEALFKLFLLNEIYSKRKLDGFQNYNKTISPLLNGPACWRSSNLFRHRAEDCKKIIRPNDYRGALTSRLYNIRQLLLLHGQCDHIGRLFFNIGPFVTMEIRSKA